MQDVELAASKLNLHSSNMINYYIWGAEMFQELSEEQ